MLPPNEQIDKYKYLNIYKYLIFSYLDFTFNQLADASIQSDLQIWRTIEEINPTIGQQYASAVTIPS